MVQYDVDRDPGAGDVQVSKHWVFNWGRRDSEQGVSGQFVFQYDVDRAPGAGDVQVNKHWVFNGSAGTRSRARQGSLWSSMT